MALMMDFDNENILDEPDDLEIVQDGGEIDRYQSDGGELDGENNEEGGGEEVKNDDGTKKDEEEDKKKKRKQSQRPKLNILRLMDTKSGLISAERMFEDVKFKGKGYESEDLNLIMRRMEIWAHKLYPSFQFDDCLAKLEKLGNTRPVATYMKKIRLGMEDQVGREADDEIVDEPVSPTSAARPASPDPFDWLVRGGPPAGAPQPQQQQQEEMRLPFQGSLTREQRERMLKNRLLAEERRMARMRAIQEKADADAAAAASTENGTRDGDEVTPHEGSETQATEDGGKRQAVDNGKSESSFSLEKPVDATTVLESQPDDDLSQDSATRDVCEASETIDIFSQNGSNRNKTYEACEKSDDPSQSGQDGENEYEKPDDPSQSSGN